MFDNVRTSQLWHKCAFKQAKIVCCPQNLNQVVWIMKDTLNQPFVKICEIQCHLHTRVGGGPGTFFLTHGNHLPWLSGVHGLKDFLCSDHLLESFDGRIYTYGSVLKSKFVHQRTHEDEHYRENPSNHELLTVRGGDCRASKKMFRGLPPP